MSYEKFYPNGWQSGETGGTPITPEALNHIEEGIKQTYSDFSPAVQSAEYPGCYYRTVNGVVEWINPPMIPDAEYRTTERWNGKVVYAKLFNCGSIATSGELPHGIGFTHLVSFFAECKGTFNDAFDKGSGYYFNAWANPYYIWFEAGSSMVSAGGDVYATLKYTKD